MARELVVVGLGGSVAAPSRSLAALKLAHESAQQAGATTELFDLQQLDLPFYDPTARRPGRAARQLLEAAHRADGMIWSSPSIRARFRAHSRTCSTGFTYLTTTSRHISPTK